jgi:opacity protein-like surface antigen
MTTRTLFLAVAALSLSTAALAADVKTYQVTGPVLDMTADTITVQKGKDKWEIGKGADTKMTGDVKTGDKVTIMYRMTATSIEAKGGATKSSTKSHGKSGTAAH